MTKYLGIEIGGTKLQLGVGAGDGGPFVELVRLDVALGAGASGILGQIQEHAPRLVRDHQVGRIGIGFGGPVNSLTGRTVKSHQVAGWDDVPLVEWCRQVTGVPAVIGNDCDVSALAEARFGAGRGAGSVFYVTVGTGVGGGFVHHGRLFGAGRPAIAEIGHLRPGLGASSPEDTVESVASGLGMARVAAACLSDDSFAKTRTRIGLAVGAGDPRLATAREDLRDRCGGDESRLNGKVVAAAAREGNYLAQAVLDLGCRTLGWALGQVVTLLAPEVVVIGGGVSLLGEEAFMVPVRRYLAAYVFPPLKDAYRVVPAELGELVTVHGAVALASSGEN